MSNIINKQAGRYGWRVDGHDMILDLGTMPKAVVIRKSLKGEYFIGDSSYFPFPEAFYKKRSNNIRDIVEMASGYIRVWLQNLIEHLNTNPLDDATHVLANNED